VVTTTPATRSNGGFGRTDGFIGYVDSHIYYGKFAGVPTGSCPYQYLAEATSSVGDAFPGSSAPLSNPWDRCADDPNGYAEVAADNGHWNSDRSTSWYYQGSATVFGYEFGNPNGFTSYVNEGWDDSGPDSTFVCGNADPVQYSSVLYDGSV
jgi:hypothetical protein